MTRHHEGSTVRRQAATGIAVLVLGVAAVLTACTAEPEPTGEVVVTGEPGVAPLLEYETPFVISEPRVEVVWEGAGPPVQEGEPILVDFYAEAGQDASVVGETYSSEPKAYLLSAEALGVDIFTALQGQTVGSRILNLVPPVDGPGPATIAVFDILPTRAQGEAVEPREGLPVVELGADGEPSISVPDTAPPTDLVVQPLIRGSGRQVAAGQVITVQFTGVSWSDGSTFDTSWGDGKLPAPFPIGVASVIEGWDVGLVEQTVGSQVLLVIPPRLGFGGTDNELADETLVFVVDILAASGGPTVG